MNSLLKTVLVTSLICASFFHQAHADTALQSAINGPQRSVANKMRDPARHPKETLEFFGIKPNMTVVELMPGEGWYTEILAPYLKPQGLLIAALQNPKSESEFGRTSFAKFQSKLNSDPAIFDKVQTTTFEPPVDLTITDKKNSVDMVLTFRNIHNWIVGGDDKMKVLFQNVYASLKKGGVFGVVEHRLPTNKVQDSTASTGYVSEEYVIKLAESVGFKLAAKSEINANPKDKADHQGGVWALPPRFINGEVDRQKYADIGESDRMTLKFVK